MVIQAERQAPDTVSSISVPSHVGLKTAGRKTLSQGKGEKIPKFYLRLATHFCDLTHANVSEEHTPSIVMVDYLHAHYENIHANYCI
jgi:hypothetical protein